MKIYSFQKVRKVVKQLPSSKSSKEDRKWYKNNIYKVNTRNKNVYKCSFQGSRYCRSTENQHNKKIRQDLQKTFTY